MPSTVEPDVRLAPLALLLLAACAGDDPDGDDTDGGVAAGSALEAALVAALGEVPDEDAVLVWSLDTPLPVGTTVAPAVQPEGTDATITLDAERLFFFVDEAPGALFEHEVAYVLVDPDTHDAVASDASWFPLVDDDVWEADLVYGHLPDATLEDGQTTSLRRSPPLPEPAFAAPRGRFECEDRKNGAVLVTGLLYPNVVRRGEAEVVSDYPAWGQAGIDALKAKLVARGYEVVTIEAAALKAARSSRAAILDGIRAHAASQPWDRFLVYYVGHGVEGGVLVPEAPRRGRYERLTATDLAAAVAGQDVIEADVALDACFSGKLAQQAPGLPEDVRPLDLDLHVLAAAGPDQLARINASGALLAQSLVRWIAARPADQPLDVSAYAVRELRLGEGRHNPTHGDAPSPIPLLEKLPADDGGCTLAGDLDHQAYDRKVTLRGIRFGDDDGRVLLDQGCLDWIEADVTYWSDTAITFHAPMGSDGLPATLVGAYQNPVASEGSLPCEGAPEAPVGAYRVRVERADGHANHGTGPSSPPVRTWAHSDRVQLRPQLYCLKGVALPDAGFPDGLEYTEFYVPVTPPSDWTDGATFVLTGVDAADALFSGLPTGIPYDDGDECTSLAPGLLESYSWSARDETPNVTPGGAWTPVAVDWFTQRCHDDGLVPPGGDVRYWGYCLTSDPPAESGQLGALVWYE